MYITKFVGSISHRIVGSIPMRIYDRICGLNTSRYVYCKTWALYHRSCRFYVDGHIPQDLWAQYQQVCIPQELWALYHKNYGFYANGHIPLDINNKLYVHVNPLNKLLYCSVSFFNPMFGQSFSISKQMLPTFVVSKKLLSTKITKRKQSETIIIRHLSFLVGVF